MRTGRVENLRPWAKGVSGNPGGRPKSAPITDSLKDMLQSSCDADPTKRTYAEVIAEMLLKRACGGDIRAAREIADRVEGRPSQSVSVVVEECSTCRETGNQVRLHLASFSDEQLRILSELLEPERMTLTKTDWFISPDQLSKPGLKSRQE